MQGESVTRRLVLSVSQTPTESLAQIARNSVVKNGYTMMLEWMIQNIAWLFGGTVVLLIVIKLVAYHFLRRFLRKGEEADRY